MVDICVKQVKVQILEAKIASNRSKKYFNILERFLFMVNKIKNSDYDFGNF